MIVNPVYISYVGFPLLMLISRVSGFVVPRNIIDVYWFILLVASIPALFNWVVCLKISRFRLFLYCSFFFVVFVKFSLPWLFYNVSLVPYLMSVKPILYYFVALGASLLFIGSDKGIFVRAGIALSLIIIFEFILGSINYAGVIRPRGSGEINYDACLILLSLIVLKNYFCSNKRLVLAILLTGLLLTFSRTAILTSLMLYLFFENKHYLAKVFAASLATVFFISSYLIRGLPIDSLERYDRFWMWTSAFELFSQQPFGFFFGFFPGVNLALDVPLNIAGLWDYQASIWDLTGVYSYNFHSFWLRMVIDYGFLPIFVMLVFMVKTSTTSTIHKKMLIFFLAMQGVTMGLFYVGNISVVMFMYIFALYGKFDTNPLVNQKG